MSYRLPWNQGEGAQTTIIFLVRYLNDDMFSWGDFEIKKHNIEKESDLKINYRLLF